jgi:hypothetical protein
MGENGKGTFLRACAWSKPGERSAAMIMKMAIAWLALKDR